MTMMYIALLSLFICGIVIARKHNDIMPFISGFLMGVAIMVGIMKHIKVKSITPLDVYRGNTELKIKSVNGVPTDTVVVLKSK